MSACARVAGRCRAVRRGLLGGLLLSAALRGS